MMLHYLVLNLWLPQYQYQQLVVLYVHLMLWSPHLLLSLRLTQHQHLMLLRSILLCLRFKDLVFPLVSFLPVRFFFS